jgi:hypothetical protein
MSSPRVLELNDLERGVSSKPWSTRRVESEASRADIGIHHRRRTPSEPSSDSMRHRRSSNGFHFGLPGYRDYEPGAPHDPTHRAPPAYYPYAASSFRQRWQKVGTFFRKGAIVSVVHLAVLAFIVAINFVLLALVVVPVVFLARQYGTVITVSPHFHIQEPSCSCLPPVTVTALHTTSSSNSSSTSSAHPVKTIIEIATHTAQTIKTIVNQPTIIVDESGHILQGSPTTMP